MLTPNSISIPKMCAHITHIKIDVAGEFNANYIHHIMAVWNAMSQQDLKLPIKQSIIQHHIIGNKC